MINNETHRDIDLIEAAIERHPDIQPIIESARAKSDISDDTVATLVLYASKAVEAHTHLERLNEGAPQNTIKSWLAEVQGWEDKTAEYIRYGGHLNRQALVRFHTSVFGAMLASVYNPTDATN